MRGLRPTSPSTSTMACRGSLDILSALDRRSARPHESATYCTTGSRQKTSTRTDFHSHSSRAADAYCNTFALASSLVAQWRFAVNILKDWGHWAACSGFGAFHGATFENSICPEFENSDWQSRTARLNLSPNCKGVRCRQPSFRLPSARIRNQVKCCSQASSHASICYSSCPAACSFLPG